MRMEVQAEKSAKENKSQTAEGWGMGKRRSDGPFHYYSLRVSLMYPGSLRFNRITVSCLTLCTISEKLSKNKQGISHLQLGICLITFT